MQPNLSRQAVKKIEKKDQKPSKGQVQSAPKQGILGISNSNVGANASFFAVIRLRGAIRVPVHIEHTLRYLRLIKNHSCVVVKNTPSNRGMLQKAKDYITWGEISEEMHHELLQKRGEKHPQNPKEMKPFFRLQPPRGGLERKGIKHTFTVGGSLGYRGDNINKLLKKMI